ncbi:MAG: hypothetical protein WDM96_13350 [Lacunisphaera sp.]
MADEADTDNVMVAVFSVAAGMIGVCLTGIGLLHVANAMRQVATLADELLAVDAMFFLGCCLAAFLSFRLKLPVQRRLRQVADALFFFGLLLMVVVCVMVTSSFL